MQSTTGKKQSEMQSDVQKIADRYEHIVYWSDEDRCYIRKCPELFFGVHGDDAEAVPRELRQAVAQNVILHRSKARCLNHITPPLSKNQKSDHPAKTTMRLGVP